MSNRRWSWDTETSEWSVELDETARMLRWVGYDKPRPDVHYSELAGGQMDQTVDDLLTTKRSPYTCPPAILAEVIAAATALRQR